MWPAAVRIGVMDVSGVFSSSTLCTHANVFEFEFFWCRTMQS